MSNTFCRVMKLLFWSTLGISWFLILLFFYFLPLFVTFPIRRMIIQRKVKRILIRSGLPRKEAKKYAKRYRKNLAKYGSVINVLKFTLKTRKKSSR